MTPAEDVRQAAVPAQHARVLLVTNMYPSPASPKFGSFVADAERAMREAGSDVTLVYATDARGGRRAVAKYLSLWMRVLSAAVRGGFDAVHAHYIFPTGWIASFASRLRGAPLVVYSHGSDVLLAARGWPVGALTRSTARRADLLLVPSDAHAALVEGELGVDPARIAVVPIGVDTAVFSRADRAEARARTGLTAQDEWLVFAGALDSNKGEGVEDVLRALAAPSLSRPRLLVVGEGPREARLRGLAEELGLHERVEFRPSMPRERVVDVLRAADVVVVPSRRESLGLVALEARALGTPVVATSVGGLPEHVEPGISGELYEPGDVDGLADALARVLEGRGQGRYVPSFDETRFGLSGTGERLVRLTDDLVAHKAALKGRA